MLFRSTLMDYRARSDFQGAANLYLSPERKPRYDRNNLHTTLEAAKALHDAGYWQLSSDAFARAHELMPWKEDSVDTPQEVLALVATTAISSAFGPYHGSIHEGGFIDYYRAELNPPAGRFTGFVTIMGFSVGFGATKYLDVC